MNWAEVEKSLREDVTRLRKQLAETPASAVATNAAAGSAVMILGLLADAVARGRQSS